MPTGVYPRTEDFKRKLRSYWHKHKHPLYKGEEASVLAKHFRIYRRYGKADRCEGVHCAGKSKIYEWANKSGLYKNVRSDWIRLCRSCHRKFDLTDVKKKYLFLIAKKWWIKNPAMRKKFASVARNQKRDKLGRFIK